MTHAKSNLLPIDIFKNHDSAGYQKNSLTFPRHCGEGRNPWGVTLTRRSPADTVWIAAFAAMTG
ncbi:MAG: hypothetical protein Q4G70_07760 [Pseudomonadota bacterium]|nr:hypothetical protein [Pseudomonadota bacterium]